MKLLGVRIDEVTLSEVVDQIDQWVQGTTKHYIVTTNLEFLIEAQDNVRYTSILNDSDLSIPDSARLAWLSGLLEIKNPIIRLFYAPLAFLPSKWLNSSFPVSTGTDLVEAVARDFNEKGYTIGLYGGRDSVAKQAADCLKRIYPSLKISFARSAEDFSTAADEEITELPKCDVLFIALGQVKQENWIVNHKAQVEAKVFIGVGGAFDYISGQVSRAPKIVRQLGFEWLYRLATQPWRIKRQAKIVWFLLKLVFS